jgi:parvulin-like peptidyl-prolyl isomerase
VARLVLVTAQMMATVTDRLKGRRSRALCSVQSAWLLVVLGLGCSPPPHTVEPVDPVLATLGIYNIELSDFLLAARSRTAPGEFPRSGSGFEAFRDRLLRDLMFETMLLVEARSRELVVSDEQLDVELSDRRAEGGANQSETARRKELNERFGSEEAYREVVRRRMLIDAAERMVRDELAVELELTEAQLEKARKRLGDTLVQREGIHARQIFVADQQTAAKLYAKLQAGADFEDVAKKHNGGNGDLGWMSLDSAPPLLVQVAEGMKPGEISEPHHSSFGYHIFQFIGRRPQKPLSREDGRVQVEKLLRSEYTESRFRDWLAKRSEESEIEVNEKAVNKLQCCRLGLPYWGKAGGKD